MAVERMLGALINIDIAQFNEHVDCAGFRTCCSFALRNTIKNHAVKVHSVRVSGMWSMTEHPHLLAEEIERDVRENIIVVICGQLIIRQL